MNEFIESEEFISDEDLMKFNENTKSEVIRDLNNKLKSVYSIDTKNIVLKFQRNIDKEFDRIFNENKQKRKNKIQIIENLSQEYVNEYDLKICQIFESISSEKELKRKHNLIVKEVIEILKQSKTSKNNKLIDIQIDFVTKEISKTFVNFQQSLKQKLKNLDIQKQECIKTDELFEKINEIFKETEMSKSVEKENIGKDSETNENSVLKYEKNNEMDKNYNIINKNEVQSEINQFYDKNIEVDNELIESTNRMNYLDENYTSDASDDSDVSIEVIELIIHSNNNDSDIEELDKKFDLLSIISNENKNSMLSDNGNNEKSCDDLDLEKIPVMKSNVNDISNELSEERDEKFILNDINSEKSEKTEHIEEELNEFHSVDKPNFFEDITESDKECNEKNVKNVKQKV